MNNDNLKNRCKKDILKFAVTIVLYLIFVLWVGSIWLLIFVPVIFDVCITKKVNWTFWKKRNGPNNVLVEWIDAIIFAVVVVSLVNLFIFQNYKIPTGSMEKTLLIGDHLYVSKLKYGPKMPNTPLSIPFMHNVIPGTLGTKSYSEFIQWPYKRLKGFTKVKRNDIVVFNFPEGDTVVLQAQNESYYGIVRQQAAMYRKEDINSGRALKKQEIYDDKARKSIMQSFDITVRPVDKRDNYVKRCVALPGETIEVKSGLVWINGEKQTLYPDVQFEYRIITDGTRLSDKFLEKMGIYRDDVTEFGDSSYIIPITVETVAVLESMPSIKGVYKVENPGVYEEMVFPHSSDYPWNVNYFGPLTIPYKGQTVNLTKESIVLYERIITAYDGNKLEKTPTGFLINGKKATTYTFGMDYYFMMGDNRDRSLDSRYWGFVPEDHIVGAPRRVWLSLDKEGTFPFNIRWNRFFKSAGGQ